MSPQRIVVRAPNWIGDVVLSLGAVRDLRRNFPKSRLTVLARPWVSELYRAVAEVDDVRQSHGVRADAGALRGQFDLGVLLPNSFGTALALWMARLPERWGYGTLAKTDQERCGVAFKGRQDARHPLCILLGLDPDETDGAPSCDWSLPSELVEVTRRGGADARRPVGRR